MIDAGTYLRQRHYRQPLSSGVARCRRRNRVGIGGGKPAESAPPGSLEDSKGDKVSLEGSVVSPIDSLGNERVIEALSVSCGIGTFQKAAESDLASLGFHIDSGAPTKLVFDVPSGYGLEILEKPNGDRLRLLIVTWNPCREYVEDLWDLGAEALLSGEVLSKRNLAEILSAVIKRVCHGERYRLTVGPSTMLTCRERAVVRYVARGYSNKEVAQALHIEEQTVKNTLRWAYRKLGLRHHAQVALYYWGLLQRVDSIGT
jgi:DNA-binding NarL/FixJ family response regulator